VASFARWFPVAAALTAGCGVTQELYNARTLELDRCQSESTRMRSDLVWARSHLDEAARARDACIEENNGLKAEKQKLGTSLQATQLEMEALRRAHAAAEQRGENFRALGARLRPLIDARTLAVEVRRGRLLIALGESALFDAGKTELTAGGQAALHQVAAALRETPDRDFLVAGHTDNQPPPRGASYRSNWELSTARAVAVVRFLQSEGVDPRHLGAAGYSEFDPVSDADAERAANRRIEIVLVPKEEELPGIGTSGARDGTPNARDAAPAPAPPAAAPPSLPAPPRP
jgi:chemotaxis protein MotB